MLFASVLFVSMIPVTTQQSAESNQPLVMIETYFVNQLSHKHPRMIALRKRIEDATGSKFQFDLREVQKRFEVLTLKRSSLLQTKGLTHPVVLENATRLSLISRILAGQSTEILRKIGKTKN